jgi:hypothetical protein
MVDVVMFWSELMAGLVWRFTPRRVRLYDRRTPVPVQRAPRPPYEVDAVGRAHQWPPPEPLVNREPWPDVDLTLEVPS